MISLTIHGTRGSLPGATPSPIFGNESICAVARGGGTAAILDAGSGALAAGAALLAEGRTDIDLVLSHLHLDHVIGLPFLPQLLRGDGIVRVHVSERYGPDPGAVLSDLLRPPWFPIPLSRLPGRLEGHAFGDGATLRFGRLAIETAPLHHPGGATGFRLCTGGDAVAVLLDHEPGDAQADTAARHLMRGVRAAVMDAAWTPQEAPGRVGWGHGCWLSCIRLAREAGAGAAYLSHHAPARDDVALLDEERRLRAVWNGALLARGGDVV
ncbi:MBL fold metallo-hydrolase [Palleronia abyssalis]|uniref:Ribonuclease BN n=1 Tax=Palleronia abyssalis TaxID=1501240 RepID=A0A2R8BZB5_9RHOB|nr:MBL fold metallo-hydrolase [Palleronia abyssalis]SPJ25463.1 Ribonuclease BN [Palleronia abyssalis]